MCYVPAGLGKCDISCFVLLIVSQTINFSADNDICCYDQSQYLKLKCPVQQQLQCIRDVVCMIWKVDVHVVPRGPRDSMKVVFKAWVKSIDILQGFGKHVFNDTIQLE